MKTFAYTNKQYMFRITEVLFTLIGLAAVTFIAINIESFWETHAGETVLLFVVAAMFAGSMFFRKSEQREDAVVTSQALRIGAEDTYPLDQLTLDIYESDDGLRCCHLYDDAGQFTLYTSSRDDLVSCLESTLDRIQRHRISDYDYDAESMVVEIKSDTGQQLTFDVDTGTYGITRASSEAQQFSPAKFIESPGYRITSTRQATAEANTVYKSPGSGQ